MKQPQLGCPDVEEGTVLCSSRSSLFILTFSYGTAHMSCNNKHFEISGPSCLKLTRSLVNDLLKFTSSDTQIC